MFAKHGDTFDRIGVNPNDGLADLLTRVAALPEAERTAIEADVAAALATGPALAMVDSDRGITNLHVPERHHHRRVHAADDPRLREDVERGR